VYSHLVAQHSVRLYLFLQAPMITRWFTKRWKFGIFNIEYVLLSSEDVDTRCRRSCAEIGSVEQYGKFYWHWFYVIIVMITVINVWSPLFRVMKRWNRYRVHMYQSLQKRQKEREAIKLWKIEILIEKKKERTRTYVSKSSKKIEKEKHSNLER
jgi:hypothetical protein